MQLVHLAREINGRSISLGFEGGGGAGQKSRLSVAGGNYRNPALHSRIIEWGREALQGIECLSVQLPSATTAVKRQHG